MKFLDLARDIDIFAKDPETDEDITYLSRIEEIGEHSLFVSPPFKKSSYWQGLQAEIGRVLSARISTERCSYFFEIELLDIGATELWEFSLPMNVTKTQRRHYVRLPIILDVTIKFVDPALKSITTFTKDISAGGMQVVLEKPPEGSDVKVQVPFNNKLTIEAKGKIIRITPPESVRGQFTVAIKFTDMPEEQQEQITKYIFNKEVERRQTEKKLFGKSLR